MIKSKITGLILLAPILLSGCWAAQWARGPGLVEDNADQLERVRHKQSELEERMNRLEALTSEQTEILRSLRAENTQFTSEMEAQMFAIQDLFAANRDQLDRVSSQVESVIHKQSRQNASSAATDSTLESEGLAQAIDPQPLYSAAYLDLIRGNYDTALMGFRAYLETYQDGAQSDDAQYWVGECYFAEGKLEEAIVQFRRVEDDFPNSDRVAPSLLKLGSSYAGLGRNDEARKVLTRLIEKHPTSVEAPLAEDILKDLG